jgi:hypothetical protein
MRLYFVYDYISYRLNKPIKRRNEDGFFGTFIISTCQLVFVGLVSSRITDVYWTGYGGLLLTVVIFVLFLFLNHRRLQRASESYPAKWMNESRLVRAIKGLLVYAVLIAHLALPQIFQNINAR